MGRIPRPDSAAGARQPGSAVRRRVHGLTRRELLERFGGVTAYQRAPAHGLWETPDGDVSRDEVVIFEVMARKLDRAWWGEYRQTLESRFRQDVVIIRALPFDRL